MSLIMKFSILTCIELAYITLLFIGFLYKPELLKWEDKQADKACRTVRKALRRSKRIAAWATAETLPEPKKVEVYTPGPASRLSLDDYLSAGELEAWERRFDAGETRQ